MSGVFQKNNQEIIQEKVTSISIYDNHMMVGVYQCFLISGISKVDILFLWSRGLCALMFVISNRDFDNRILARC